MSESDTQDRENEQDGRDEQDGTAIGDGTDQRDVPVNPPLPPVSRRLLISPDSWWPGDVIGLPPEPPVGTMLQVHGGPRGGLRIVRGSDGWSAGAGSWLDVYRSVGPASAPGVIFVVVKAPMRCAGCEMWLPVDAPAQQRYHDDNCRRRSSRSRHG